MKQSTKIISLELVINQSTFMSLMRYDQIHGYFTLWHGAVGSRKVTAIYAWKVEPITIIVKQDLRYDGLLAPI